ncbi:hypothetical protein [Alishewanella phage vB_AspM_Slicko01]|nr:hypothetical protein [Alishewanella phage vB_AspM_Slicko01]
MKSITLNNIEPLYDAHIIKTFDGKFACPVCRKEAKKESTIQNHMDQRNCYSLINLCSDTVYEEIAILFCKEQELNFNIATLRKSKFYNTILSFVLYACSLETKPDLLYAYVDNEKPSKNFIQQIACADEWVDVLEFRRWLQRNSVLIDSAGFFKANRQSCNHDIFLQRSIIKGKISAEYIFNNEPSLINQMGHGLFLELSEFLEGV